MPRNMSFSLTTPQVRAKTKTVTRRLGWSFLKRGEVVQTIEKGQGLKKGEHVKRICLIRITHVSREPLSNLKRHDECIKEGFEDLSPTDFVSMFCKHNGCTPETMVNRIEFEYL